MKQKRLMRVGIVCLSTGALSAGMLFGADEAEAAATRLTTSAAVLREVMATPDQAIPEDLLAKSTCIVIVPGMKKVAFVFGGQYGKGFMLCRLPSGSGWSAPAAMMIEGGSFGFQIGASETDIIMLVMNERGVEKLLSSKFTLGADASVAAGPVGHTASADTDLQLQAEILSYSRSRGAFAGVSLSGATLRPDNDTNAELYGGELTNQEIVSGTTKATSAGSELMAQLSEFSIKKKD